ncbi:MAG: polymer-forming cytoskeletal protein [Clostridiales bacterium]|nr:polymer-forming cytoskeletal protein [Clostridiales bacterium]
MRKNKNDSIVRCIVGAKTVLEGTMRTEETTRIEGTVNGNIIAEGTLIIGATGKVNGDITAQCILIAGEVSGDLYASTKIEASASGRIYGNIKTKSLVIDEKAVFQGSCEMNVSEEQIKASKETAVEVSEDDSEESESSFE